MKKDLHRWVRAYQKPKHLMNMAFRDSSISPYFAYMNMRCIRLAMMISITAVIKARFTQASDFLLSVSVHSVHLALPSGVKPFGS